MTSSRVIFSPATTFSKQNSTFPYCTCKDRWHILKAVSGRVSCPCCTNLHHIVIDLLGISVNEIYLFGVAVLHKLLLVGVVLVLIRHGGAAGAGPSEESEDKPSWITVRAAASVYFGPPYHNCGTPADMPGDSCCRRPGKNGGLSHPPTHPPTPHAQRKFTLTHSHTL